MRETLLHSSGLNQQHTQMMMDTGMLRMGREQGAIGFFRYVLAAGAMVRQRLGECRVEGLRVRRHGRDQS